MNFEDLHELVRLEVARRIERGDLTGTALARQAGFKQAHISNFVNGKRALSLGGLDRVLAAQQMSVDQILPLEINGAAEGLWREPTHRGETAMNGTPGSRREPTQYGEAVLDGAPGFGVSGFGVAERVEVVPVVPPSTAMDHALVRPGVVIETVAVAASRLRECRARVSPKRAGWQRFVAVRADGQQAAAMAPVLSDGSTVLIDRHYNSLAPYRAQQRTLFAVRTGAGLALRYVDYDEDRLILRPLAAEYPVQLIALGEGEVPADYIVGRVCMVVSEL